jgi:hypothetical protein
VTAAVLRLALTPALIALATLVGRRWGPAVGGAVVGLPLTSGPVSIFLALDHGPAFAATAAVATLLGLLSQAAFCLAFGWAGRRASWPVCAATGVLAFAATTVALSEARLTAGPAFAAVSAALLAATWLMPAGPLAPLASSPPPWDLPVRMLLGAAVVGVLTGVAGLLGPRWTGLLSPFPVFALVLGSFAHRGEGPPAAAALLRGIVLGSLAHATMFAIIAALLETRGLAPTYTWASLGAVAVNALAVAGVRRGSRPGRRVGYDDGVGLEIVVPRDRPLPLRPVLDALGAAGVPAVVAMADNALRAPGAPPPEDWRDVRLRTPAGMVTLRRQGDGIAVLVFGNADAALQAAQRAVAEAVRTAP